MSPRVGGRNDPSEFVHRERQVGDSGLAKPFDDLRHEAGLPLPRRSGQQQRLPTSCQLLDDGGRLGASDVGAVDQAPLDPARVGLVAVVDPRSNLGARGERLLNAAVLLQLLHHVVRSGGLSQPAPCEIAQEKTNVDGVSRPAISALDERGDSLLHGAEELTVFDRPEFGSPELLVRVGFTLGEGCDLLVERRLKPLRQQVAELLKTRGGSGPLGELTHVSRAVLADEHCTGTVAPLEVAEQVAENAPPRRWSGTGELVGRPRIRRAWRLPLD